MAVSATLPALTAEKPVHEVLQAYRIERDLTYRELAGLLGVTVAVAFKATHGGRLNERNSHKIKRFLEKLHAAL